LGAAGILKGLPATTHWYKMGALRIMDARPEVGERIVRSDKIITAAGVSAGIDLALWLAGEITGRARAEAIQLAIDYDPHPPFHTRHMSKSSRETQKRHSGNNGTSPGCCGFVLFNGEPNPPHGIRILVFGAPVILCSRDCQRLSAFDRESVL
jgi:hypothetical protein